MYSSNVEGCRDYYGPRGSTCDFTEKDRLDMSLRQPQSMVVRNPPSFRSYAG